MRRLPLVRTLAPCCILTVLLRLFAVAGMASSHTVHSPHLSLLCVQTTAYAS